MRIRLMLLMSVLGALLAGNCLAEAVVENAAIFKGDDPRLEQTVTYWADGITLAEALGNLSQSTGVVMNAGIDNDDWWVRDRKVIIVIKDMKLQSLMQELAAVLRFHWSRGGESGKWTYRLWQDNQQRAEEDSLRASRQDAETRQAREKRENALGDLINLGSLNASDASGLKSSDPWRYILAAEPLGRDLAEFLGGFPDARNAFIQGTEVSFPASQLSPDLQDTVRRIAQSYDGLAQKIGIAEDHAMLLDKIDKLQVTINRRTAREDVVSKSMLGRITISSGAEMLDIPLFDPSSSIAKALGSAIVSLQGGASKEEVGKRLQEDIQAAANSQQATGSSGRDTTSDPALREKLKLFDEPTVAPLPMVLASLASRSGLNVISDYFPGARPTVSSEQKTLGEHLEMISSEYGSAWEKAGRTLRFRDKEWFSKRAREVPEVWIKYWTDRAKLNKGLRLQDLTEIACLLDEQIDYAIMKNPDLVRFGAGDAATNRQILRFYGMLNASQKTTLAQSHLSASSLNDEQWSALQRALATKGAAYAATDKGSQFLRLTQSGSDIIEYQFNFYPGENQAPVVFKVASGAVFLTEDEAPPPPVKRP